MSHTHADDPIPPSCFCVKRIFKNGPCFPQCGGVFLVPPPPPPPPPVAILPSRNNDGRSLFVTGMTVVGTMLCSVLLLCIFFLIVRFYFNKRINDSRRRSLPVIFFGTRDDIWADELDHPMWYINTVGLQQSVIDSITVFKYRKDEALIEGTECSVCLSEFEEDESLRLLPKCSHGFHVPCIDTWLRSHKNCPLCRAPVVCETMVAQTSDENDETRVEIQVGEEGTGEEIEDGNSRENAVSDFDGVQETRRSVSLDLRSAIEIGGEATAGHKHGGSLGTEFEQLKYSKGKISGKRSCSSMDKLTKSSSSGRSLSMGPVSMKRSLSSGGIFLLSKRSKSQESILPL